MEFQDEVTGDSKSRLRKSLEVIGVVAGVVGAVAGLVSLKPILLDDDSGKQAGAPSSFVFVDPRSGTVTRKPCTFEVHGTGTPPSGKSLAVANRKSNERFYFESSVKVEQGEWSAEIGLGTSKTKPGTRFHLSVVLMDAVWEQYLAGVTDEEGATYWSSEGLPPGGKVVASAEIDVHPRTATGDDHVPSGKRARHTKPSLAAQPTRERARYRPNGPASKPASVQVTRRRACWPTT